MKRILAVLLLMLSPIAYAQDLDAKAIEKTEELCRLFEGFSVKVYAQAEAGTDFRLILLALENYAMSSLLTGEDPALVQELLPRMRNILIFTYRFHEELSLEEITLKVYTDCTTFFLKPLMSLPVEEEV